MSAGQFMPSCNSRAVRRNSLSGQSNDCLDMPWDNSVNKKAHIHAVAATLLVEQFPLSEKVEWADLIIDQDEIIP